MQTQTLPLNSAAIEKTRELCTLILESDSYRDQVARIEGFFEDDAAQQQYRDFSQLGQELHQKQQEGALTEDDIALYERKQSELNGNETVAGFMEAESVLNGIVKEVSRFVGKSLELGRLPEPEDLDSGECCNSGGCGCA